MLSKFNHGYGICKASPCLLFWRPYMAWAKASLCILLQNSARSRGVGKTFWLGGHSLKLHIEQWAIYITIYETWGGTCPRFLRLWEGWLFVQGFFCFLNTIMHLVFAYLFQGFPCLPFWRPYMACAKGSLCILPQNSVWRLAACAGLLFALSFLWETPVNFSLTSPKFHHSEIYIPLSQACVLRGIAYRWLKFYIAK